MSEHPKHPVALPTRGIVVFPGMLRILAAGRPTSVRAIERHVDDGVPLVLVPQLDSDEDDPLEARIGSVGVTAQVLRSTRLPDGSLRVLVEAGITLTSELSLDALLQRIVETAARLTGALWPSVRRSAPLCGCHSRITFMTIPTARVWPSGEKATHQPCPKCPVKC